jgi:hypothetical protein
MGLKVTVYIIAVKPNPIEFRINYILAYDIFRSYIRSTTPLVYGENFVCLYPLLGTGLPYGLHIRKMGHNPPREPIVDWRVPTTVNAAGTNGLTCLRKQVTNLMTDQSCLTFTKTCRKALTAGPSSSSTTTLLFIVNIALFLN